MKKIISLLLCMLLAFGSVGVVAATAAEQTKTDEFIAGLKSSKSISVKISDSSFKDYPIKIKNVTASLVGDDIAITGTVFGFLKAKVLIVDGVITAYIPGILCKANVSEILGIEPIDLSVIDDLWDKAGALFEYKDKGYLVYSGSTSEAPLTVENYEPDMVAIVEGEFADAIAPGTDVTEMSVQEILNLIMSADSEAGTKLRLWSQSNAKFYYNSDGELVNIIINMPNDEETEMEDFNLSQMVSSELGFYVDGISTNVSKSVVSAPAFAINISGLLSSIIKSIFG